MATRPTKPLFSVAAATFSSSSYTQTHAVTPVARLCVGVVVCVFVCMWVSFCDPFWRTNARACCVSRRRCTKQRLRSSCCWLLCYGRIGRSWAMHAVDQMHSIHARETEANTQNCNLLSDAFAFYKRQRLHQQCWCWSVAFFVGALLVRCPWCGGAGSSYLFSGVFARNAIINNALGLVERENDWLDIRTVHVVFALV